METNKHYFLVGLFVLATTIGALVFTVWLTSANKGDYAHYRIRFAESVSGLSVGGAVKFRGVDVGSVESIKIDQYDTRLIRVDIQILNSTPVKVDTVASLKLQGITGVVYVELTGGSVNSPDLVRERNNFVPEIKAQSSTISAIVDRLPEMLDRISKAVEQINKIVSNDNVATMTGILEDTRNITRSMAEDMKQVQPLLKNVSSTAAGLNRSSQQLDSLMHDLKRTSRNAATLSESLKEDPSRLIFPSPQNGVPAP